MRGIILRLYAIRLATKFIIGALFCRDWYESRWKRMEFVNFIFYALFGRFSIKAQRVADIAWYRYIWEFE